MHFCGPAWWLGLWAGRHPPCQMLVAVCHLGHALNTTVSKMASQRPACLHCFCNWWGLASFDSSKIAPLWQGQPHQRSPSKPQVSPGGRRRNSRVYLPSKVKSGLDRQRKVLTREIPFKGEQGIHNLLKLLLVLHHLLSPTVTLRRSRLWLVALSRGTCVPSPLWATCRKRLSGDNKHHNAPDFPPK